MAKKPKVFDPLAGARTDPKKVTVLALNPAAARNAGLGLLEPYPAFPPEILACTNLTSLEIFRGIAYDGDPTIPNGIAALAKLKHLGLGGLAITKLPEAIGKLAQLEELELYYDEELVELPKSLGSLTKLKKLQCGYCSALTRLPTSIGKLRDLHELNLGHTALAALPKQVWELTKLDTLWLPEDLEQLPPGIAKLTALRTLSISAAALATIATELPKLKLTSLTIFGKATALPAQLGQIATLSELRASYVGLTALPSLSGLTALTKLSIAGNQLTSVIATVQQLPVLEQFDYANNTVPLAERRIVDAAMKQKPGKRTYGGKPAAPAGPVPVLLGRVSAINAALTLVIADASILAGYAGVGDDHEDEDSDWAKAIALGSGELTIANGAKVLVIDFNMGSGVADVYRIGDALIVVEGIGEHDEDPMYLEWLASPLVRPAKAGTVALPTKVLAINPATDAGTKVKVAAGKHVEFGDERSGIAIHVGHPTATFAVEKHVEASWGNARRCQISFA